jgi:hypothetical protein
MASTGKASRFGLLLVVLATLVVLTPEAASATPYKLYNNDLAGYSQCSGIGGTFGGSFGMVRLRLAGANSTATFRARGLSPSALYDVRFVPVIGNSCATQYDIGDLMTDGHGNGSGSYTFDPTGAVSGNFDLIRLCFTDCYATQQIGF